jgi:tryptophan 2-C-methyltransferase
MLTLINTNRMLPPIAPVGLDYVAGAVRRAGVEVELLDLCMVENPHAALAEYFASREPELIGVTLRNVDDCFWPSGSWFLPQLQETIAAIRALSDAPLAIGGGGFSIFAADIVARCRAEFGIRGDGEQATVQLLDELRGDQQWERVPGLLWPTRNGLQCNPPAWPENLQVPTARDVVDNRTYFARGGQIGVETKRGCPRPCIYCADPLAKGEATRLRAPMEVADEFTALLEQKIDVVHLCDAEFNIPLHHAKAVCDELIRRGLGQDVRWYAYLAVTPFDAELAERMARAGCVGINFTSDAASPAMLAVYRQPHRPDDLLQAVQLCRQNGIAVMLDLLLGGPGETPETLAESIGFFRRLEADCFGAALGLRIYPNTQAARLIAAEAPWEDNPSLRRHYQGPVDLLQPTFYISSALGPHPARLVRELIAGDQRFFAPQEESAANETAAAAAASSDHNYNENRALSDAIAAGARGAYWDILRRLRQG